MIHKKTQHNYMECKYTQRIF